MIFRDDIKSLSLAHVERGAVAAIESGEKALGPFDSGLHLYH